MKLAELISTYHNSWNPAPSAYLIAEAGVNHEGSMDLAKRLIAEAAEGGAQAIKFQSYKAHTLASRHSPAYWDTTKEPTLSQYELFKKHDKFWKAEFEQLKIECDQNNIEFLSTPFDVESADFLNDLMEVYKISSSDLTNFPFIEHICKKEKPIMLSTGASFMWEVHEVVELIERFGNKLCLLHCVLNYPTLDENANLAMITDLKRHFPNHPLGYSDHTLPGEMDNLISAYLLGAFILEKHFTHDKTLPGNDHYHAMDKKDMLHFTKKMEHLRNVLGTGTKTSLDIEETARENARRSLVAKNLIKEGNIINEEDLTWKRPALGISPKYIYDVVGKRALEEIAEDTQITWNMIT